MDGAIASRGADVVVGMELAQLRQTLWQFKSKKKELEV